MPWRLINAATETQLCTDAFYFVYLLRSLQNKNASWNNKLQGFVENVRTWNYIFTLAAKLSVAQRSFILEQLVHFFHVWNGEHGWPSGVSTRFPLIWVPGFDSQTRRHVYMWAEIMYAWSAHLKVQALEVRFIDEKEKGSSYLSRHFKLLYLIDT